jgi:hypothetical protein
VTRAQPNRKPRKTGSIRNCIEQGITSPAPVRLAGNVRAWPVAEASAIIAAARGERILSEPRRPISETSFSMLAWEGRTAQQMRGDGQAEAKYDIRVNCDLCGKRLPHWQQAGRVRANARVQAGTSEAASALS